MDDAKNLLDQLFGQNRNLSYKEQKVKKEMYSDEFVCKPELISKCFKTMFVKTKPYDEGVCKKRHDPIFKLEFEADESLHRYRSEKRYIQDALYYIENMIADVDNKIKSKQGNLEYKAEGPTPEMPKEVAERLEMLEEEIQNLLDQSLKFGEEGKLDESEQAANQAEQKRQLKADTIKLSQTNALGLKSEQVVCEICGAYQSTSELDKRRLIHLEGKIHVGFKFFREEVTRLNERKQVVIAKIEELEKKRDSSRSPRRKSSRDRDSRRDRRRDSRSPRRSHRDRSDSRDRKKSKKHHSKKHSSRRRSYSRSNSSDRDRKKKSKHSSRRNRYSSSSSRSRSRR